MKDTETKIQFVKERAAGLSYAAIADKLGIAKSTAVEWDNKLAEDIAKLKAENLKELYETYHMTKEARIRATGDMISRIDEALSKIDLSEIPADKLLEIRAKYSDKLESEYDATDGDGMDSMTREELEDAEKKLKAGELSLNEARRIMRALSDWDTIDLQLDTMQSNRSDVKWNEKFRF